MNWFIDNWYIIVGAIAVLTVAIVSVYKFFGLPTDKQIANVKEWLKYAVSVSEKELGSKTGQLKLRMVYDMFVTKFPTLSRIVSFATFSLWVDNALEWLNEQLEQNKAVESIVKGE